ncbi:MAG: hypothetical protein KAU50_09340 [Candidatus Marinimicrobia bacterium]|nr:hypothetical protein [Candidatus Neomarinimicrobiota bacterium]
MINPGWYMKRYGSIIALVLCLMPVSTLLANMRFFTAVMKNCQHYRVTGDQIQFDLEGQGTGSLTFNLTLPARRNNFEEVIMAGYLSTGYAIARTGLKVKTIYITAIIPSDDNRLKTTKADAVLVARLISKEIDPHKFLGEIDWLE